MAGKDTTGIGSLMAVFTAIIGLAMVAVIVSQKANTAKVLQALTSGVGNVIGAAVSPVTGGGGGPFDQDS